MAKNSQSDIRNYGNIMFEKIVNCFGSLELQNILLSSLWLCKHTIDSKIDALYALTPAISAHSINHTTSLIDQDHRVKSHNRTATARIPRTGF